MRENSNRHNYQIQYFLFAFVCSLLLLSAIGTTRAEAPTNAYRYDEATKTLTFLSPQAGESSTLEKPGVYEKIKPEHLVIEEGYTSIGDYAFRGYQSISSIVLPSSLTSIGQEVFSDITSVKSVTFPANLNSVGNYAFQKCTSLENVTLNSSMTELPMGLFMGCTSLKSISIPSNIKRINSRAFADSGIETLVIPSSVEYVGRRILTGAWNLRRIENYSNLQSYELGMYEDFERTRQNFEHVYHVLPDATVENTYKNYYGAKKVTMVF